jgi:serine/threonine-protein kinase
VNALEAGNTLGSYRILARLRAGSMGVLYLARRLGGAEFSRPVAIKVIHHHLAQNPRFSRMFIDEARLSVRIDHPNVVRVEEFGEADGRFYQVMEYVNGVSIAQLLGVLQTGDRLPIEIAVAIAMAIAGGLHGAHEATDENGVPLNIVHRDVSPHNILVSHTGAVRLIDFGIAKARQVGGQTRTGSLRGKLAYMPPEQAKSARTVDRRADLYGLGLVLWEMLTFRRVFDADNDIALMNQIRTPLIVPPSSLAPAVPSALDDVILYTLALDPEERPRSGLVLQRALADAFPAALRVMPTDLAALVMKVRAQATALAEGHDDPSGLYGEEIRRGLTIFGRQSRESANFEAEQATTHPNQPELRKGLPSVIVDDGPPAPLDDDTTLSLAAPVVAPPPPSTAMPVAPRPSGPMAVTRPMPLLMPMPMPTVEPPAAGVLSPRHKVVIAVVAPIAAASLIGIGIVVGGRGVTPPDAIPDRERGAEDGGARRPPPPVVTAVPVSRE